MRKANAEVPQFQQRRQPIREKVAVSPLLGYDG
jgi:hypothetical protein